MHIHIDRIHIHSISHVGSFNVGKTVLSRNASTKNSGDVSDSKAEGAEQKCARGASIYEEPVLIKRQQPLTE